MRASLMVDMCKFMPGRVGHSSYHAKYHHFQARSPDWSHPWSICKAQEQTPEATSKYWLPYLILNMDGNQYYDGNTIFQNRPLSLPNCYAVLDLTSITYCLCRAYSINAALSKKAYPTIIQFEVKFFVGQKRWAMPRFCRNMLLVERSTRMGWALGKKETDLQRQAVNKKIKKVKSKMGQLEQTQINTGLSSFARNHSGGSSNLLNSRSNRKSNCWLLQV